MKRFFLLASLGVLACHRDRDLKICEYNPDYCADASPDADAISSETELDTGSAPDVETDSIADTGSTPEVDTDAAIDSTSTESGSDSSVADTTVADSIVADTTVADSTVADTTVVDSSVADTTVVDSSVADTAVADSSVTDTFVADTFVADTCVCTPGETVPVTGTCYGVLEKKTKTCSSSCAWGPETCAIPKGWTKIADPPTGFEGRIFPAFASTGGELIIHGGQSQLEGGTLRPDGAIFSLAKNSWTLLPTTGAPSTRGGHPGVWTGDSFIVWGGNNGTAFLADGAIYDAYTKKWSSLPTAPIAARSAHRAVWIPGRKELFIWGGYDSTGELADGAVFQSDTATWYKLPAAPITGRRLPVIVWLGSEVLVWGGANGGDPRNDGALFDPVKKTWRAVPTAPVPARILTTFAATAPFAFYGGVEPTTQDNGARLDSTTLAWTTIPAAPSSSLPSRGLPNFWSMGNTLYLWSGAFSDMTLPVSGASFDVTSGVWSAMASVDAPLGRVYATAAALTKGGVVWGGIGQPSGGIFENLTDGAIYVP